MKVKVVDVHPDKNVRKPLDWFLSNGIYIADSSLCFRYNCSYNSLWICLNYRCDNTFTRIIRL